MLIFYKVYYKIINMSKIVLTDNRESQDNKWDGHDDGSEYGPTEELVISGTDALIQPFAMVIKYVNAFVANWTMLGPLAWNGDVTQMTTAVFNDVRMSVSIELWNWPFGV